MPNIKGDTAARKAQPIYSGVIRYFPRALAAIAELSRIGNDQHNPGKPLHWDRSKSGDELDALSRHLVDAGSKDTDNVWHDTKVAWRALANLEKLLERVASGVDYSALERAPSVARGGVLPAAGTIGPRYDGNAVDGLAGPGSGLFKSGDPGGGHFADMPDLTGVDWNGNNDEATPFVPMTFSRPPRTEDPEDDGEATADAESSKELEPVDENAPDPAEYAPVMVRYTEPVTTPGWWRKP